MADTVGLPIDFIATFRKCLEDGKYYPVEQLTDPELEAVLFKPGKERLKIIQWGLSCFDNGLKTHLAETDATTLPAELEKYAVEFGLCPKGAEGIVTGNATVKQQILFWKRLMSTVVLCKSSEESGFELADMSECITEVSQSEEFEALLNKKIKPVPVEMESFFSPIPQEEVLQAAEAYVSRLNQAEKNKSPVTTVHGRPSSRGIEDLKAATQRMIQTIKRFERAYDQEIQHCATLKGPQPHDDTFGLLCKSVQSKAADINELIQTKKTITNCIEEMQNAGEANCVIEYDFNNLFDIIDETIKSIEQH